MSQANRLALALLIVIIDAITFFVPLGALFLAYVLVANPRWFRDFLARLG